MLPSCKPHIRVAAQLAALGSAARHFKSHLAGVEESAKNLNAEIFPQATRRDDHAAREIFGVLHEILPMDLAMWQKTDPTTRFSR